MLKLNEPLFVYNQLILVRRSSSAENNNTNSAKVDIRGGPIDRPADQLADFWIFFINRHRPIVLQIRPINIQVRLQETLDAAS